MRIPGKPGGLVEALELASRVARWVRAGMKFFGLSSISASDVAQWGIGLDAQRGIRVETHTGSLTGAALTTHGAHLHATPRKKFERQLERERVRVARSFYQTYPSCPSLLREAAAADLVETDRFTHGLEIALAEALHR